jgi:hypothetical protein
MVLTELTPVVEGASAEAMAAVVEGIEVIETELVLERTVKSTVINAEALGLWRKTFDEAVAVELKNRTNTSQFWTRDELDVIRKVLNGVDGHGLSAHQVRRRKEKWIEINKVLCLKKPPIENKSEKQQGQESSKRSKSVKESIDVLPVICSEEFFDKMYQLHCLDRGHAGMEKTEKDVNSKFAGITRAVVLVLFRSTVHNPQ